MDASFEITKHMFRGLGQYYCYNLKSKSAKKKTVKSKTKKSVARAKIPSKNFVEASAEYF